MTATSLVLRVGTQCSTAGALVSLGGVDTNDGVPRAHVGVGHPGAGRPSWLRTGESATVPGWGVLTLDRVALAGAGEAQLTFVPEQSP